MPTFAYHCLGLSIRLLRINQSQEIPVQNLNLIRLCPRFVSNSQIDPELESRLRPPPVKILHLHIFVPAESVPIRLPATHKYLIGGHKRRPEKSWHTMCSLSSGKQH